MPDLLVIVTRAISLRELDALDSRATAIALTQPAIDSFDRRLLERWAGRSSFGIALIDGSGRLAAALLADFCALSGPIGRRALDDPDVIAALIWRLGFRTLSLLATEPEPLPAERAVELGLADALVPAAQDPLHWIDRWIGHRSLAALASAARLIRTSRNESGERIEFARLFSTGEPQRGLRNFLNKKKLDFSSGRIVETI